MCGRFFSNAAAVLLMLLVLAAGLVPAMLLKPWSLIGQLVALWLTLTLLAALFGFSAYCSYRLVFADAAPTPRPAAPPPPSGARHAPRRRAHAAHRPSCCQIARVGSVRFRV